jgi:hypothetical protein
MGALPLYLDQRFRLLCVPQTLRGAHGAAAPLRASQGRIGRSAKHASNNRGEGTAAEFKVVAARSPLLFRRLFTRRQRQDAHCEHRHELVPNSNGAKQNRSITLTGDELTVINPAALPAAGQGQMEAG